MMMLTALLAGACIFVMYSDHTSSVGKARVNIRVDLALASVTIALIGRLTFLKLRTRRPAGDASEPRSAPAPMAPAALDPLTGLPGTREFCAAIEHMLAVPRKGALLILDLDDFRQLRSMHGSGAMEALLCAVAIRVRDLAPPEAALARLYGDEFAMLLPCTDAAHAAREVVRLLRGLCGGYVLAGQTLEVSVSAGISMLPAHAATADQALRAARLAVAQAKCADGGGWRVFDSGMGIAADAAQELGTELRGALLSGQIVPYYQPVVSLQSGEIVGFEVLARWQHPRRGLLPPDQFIGIAEQQRLCADLSLILLQQVTIDASKWPEHWTFAFNASVTQLRDMLHFISNQDRLRNNILDPRRIELEVTESVLIDDMALAREVVRAMHEAGAKVVLDDFGTGYANFFHLRELPFDRVKIDRSFVRDMMVSSRTDACVRAILALARSLGATVIAEGVETEAAEAQLRAMGCDFAQGYFYAPPIPAAAVSALLQRAAA